MLSPAKIQDFFLKMRREKSKEKAKKGKNEVIVLGTIHSGHLTDPVYHVAYLKKLIKQIKPDIILTEIPPDRLDAAMSEFKMDGVVREPRVKVFPEYVNVIFPLTKEMHFEIIPTAGWTKFMNDDRNKKLKDRGKSGAKSRLGHL